jgi:8-oxo-dGTP diphosphatase
MNESTHPADAGPAVALACPSPIERDGRYLLVLRANPAGPKTSTHSPAAGSIPDEALPDGSPARTRGGNRPSGRSNPRVFARFDLTVAAQRSGSLRLPFPADRLSGRRPGRRGRSARDDAQAVGWFTPEEIRALPAPESMRECIAMLTGRATPRSDRD